MRGMVNSRVVVRESLEERDSEIQRLQAANDNLERELGDVTTDCAAYQESYNNLSATVDKAIKFLKDQDDVACEYVIDILEAAQ